MKNLKSQFKLIIYLFILLSTSNITIAKNSDKFSNSKDVSNYLSGVLSINDNQYQKSYTYLKSLNNLEDSHYIYSQYYQYSLVALGNLKDAAKYSKKLKDKKIDNFESNLISAIYYLQDKDFKSATFFLKKLKDKNQPGTFQNLLSTSLNAWIDFKDLSNLNAALKALDAIPERFKNVKNIQKTFAYCYFDSPRADEIFKQLTSNSDINYSRYHFFHSNYLISKDEGQKANKIIQLALGQFPKNLILNQLKLDFEKRKVFSNKFDCKNISDVIAEILYVTSNALAAQNNYIASNFYLNLAKYLNPNFVSFDTLYAENLLIIQEYEEAKKIYIKVKKKGAVYNWYASKQIASIFLKQDEKEEAMNF